MLVALAKECVKKSDVPAEVPLRPPGARGIWGEGGAAASGSPHPTPALSPQRCGEGADSDPPALDAGMTKGPVSWPSDIKPDQNEE